MKKLSKKAQDVLLTKNGVCKKMISQIIKESLVGNISRPISYQGSGRNISTRDMSHYIIQALNLMGYKYETGNDAPRGGAAGFYIKMSKAASNALVELSNK